MAFLVALGLGYAGTKAWIEADDLNEFAGISGRG
jgi:hypothetical protein